MKRKAALYPFSPEHLPVVKYFEQLQNEYKLTKLISPSGLGLTAKDAGFSCNHPNTGLLVSENLELEKDEWDVLIATRSIHVEIENETKQFEFMIKNTLEAEKTVLYFDKSMGNISADITDSLKRHWGKLSIYADDEYSYNSKIDFGKYHEIDTPVILVGGLVAESDSFDVLSHLAARFRADGLHTTVLTRSPVGKLFGFHNMGHIFDSLKYTEAEKIAKMNHFIKDLEFSEIPDIILIEAPDAVLRYSNIVPNGFGIQTYMLSEAVPPDYFVCCVPLSLAYEALLSDISKGFEKRLGIPITAIHISNLFIDSVEMIQTRKLSYARDDLDRVRKRLAQERQLSKIPMYNTIDDGIEGLYSHIINAGLEGFDIC